MKSTHIKRASIIICAIAFAYNLSACTPLIVIGAAASANATIATDRRSAGKMVEDQAIEIQASDFIYSHKIFGKKVRVAVTSINGVVLLSGEVPNAEYRDIIYNKVTRMRPVKDVINKIQVRSLLSLEDRSNDVWITSKVKTHILAKKGLLSRTKVVTSDSKVYLMGMVNNAEADEIIAIVENMAGIKDVVPLYESYNGKLSKDRSAKSHQMPYNVLTAQQERDKAHIAEDEITIKPYVITPPITLNNDE